MLARIKEALAVALDGLVIGLIFAGGILIGFLSTLPFWY